MVQRLFWWVKGETHCPYIGGHTEAVDFVDHFRGEGEAFYFNWEERWIRDEGYMKIAPNASTTC
ncbi:MAG: hypothetical protein Ct9H300mP14_12590 [Gammaproteobacteria bacterium]|nr:MAG: hypothetical protein Ct9H300mP14_12590 [Gammaproteobacteria bacterium]